ncbi:hypothetical protein HPP92_012346 [Vanilla planifolia]|uniref:Uncharacterized protein n=1 Tax=Vanilla planifolia TaxID=51239 RepID=A0A835R1D6_VANPL|nr:hypothetical protein HPP92_012746 [Vanilla planifolia]KAG0477627.1 hypothetical protein HPP92_012346 [Vanilla planifolia]
MAKLAILVALLALTVFAVSFAADPPSSPKSPFLTPYAAVPPSGSEDADPSADDLDDDDAASIGAPVASSEYPPFQNEASAPTSNAGVVGPRSVVAVASGVAAVGAVVLHKQEGASLVKATTNRKSRIPTGSSSSIAGGGGNGGSMSGRTSKDAVRHPSMMKYSTLKYLEGNDLLLIPNMRRRWVTRRRKEEDDL